MDKRRKMIKRLNAIEEDYFISSGGFCGIDSAVISSEGILGPYSCDVEVYIDSNEIKETIDANNLISQYSNMNQEEIDLLENGIKLQIDKAKKLLKDDDDDFIQFLIDTIDTESINGFYYVYWEDEYMLVEDWLYEGQSCGVIEFQEWDDLDDCELEMWYDEVVRLKI